ncbi:MAG: sulfatase-like hydrolase/transferase, partial [Phycisphaeraceae bacterium]|nr:sulfatase-like hydrolase/transferase [Phycisphaeraceae bacterium]
MPTPSRPHVIFLFADQWRGQDLGFAGNDQVITPHMDRLAAESRTFENAVSGCPVCTPYRGTLMTGQYPVRHGLFVNDVCLSDDATSIAEAFTDGGYQTAYIGKWHIDGHGRSSYIPPERRQGFDGYWKVLECTHDYNDSQYYEGDSDEPKTWDDYDAIAQTRDLIDWINDYDDAAPFFSVLSWGPPHAPYRTAPERYQQMYDPAEIKLRDNVPESIADRARKDIAGYYAHITALDDCVGELLACLEEKGIADNTILVLTSDHGD